MHERHSPLWRSQQAKLLKGRTGGHECTFAQCRFDGEYQKYTTLMYSPGFESLSQFNELKCNHRKGPNGEPAHKKIAGGERKDGKFTSHDSAAYPPMFNLSEHR